MNASLTPWLLDFCAVCYSDSSGCLLFLNWLLILLLVLQGCEVFLATPPSWLELIIGTFLCSYLKLKMEEDNATFLAYCALIILSKIKIQLKCKKQSV